MKGRGELMVRLTTMILPNAYEVNLNASPGGAAGTGGGETIEQKEGKITGDSDKTSDAATIAKTTAAGAGIGASLAAVHRVRELERGSARLPDSWRYCCRVAPKRSCRAAQRSMP